MFIFWNIFIYFFILFATFFQSFYFIYYTQKVATHYKEQNKKKNHDNWLKNKKVIECQKMSKKCPKKLKIFSLKIHKGIGIYKNSQNLPK